MSSAHSPTDQQGRVARVPMVAARAIVDLVSPELAHGNDQRGLQKTTVVKVIEQGQDARSSIQP